MRNDGLDVNNAVFPSLVRGRLFHSKNEGGSSHHHPSPLQSDPSAHGCCIPVSPPVRGRSEKSRHLAISRPFEKVVENDVSRNYSVTQIIPSSTCRFSLFKAAFASGKIRSLLRIGVRLASIELHTNHSSVQNPCFCSSFC